MERKFYCIVALLSLILSAPSSFAQFIYVSPSPGSKYQNPETGIILRSQNPIDAASLSKRNLFQVEGSVSGVHEVKMKLLQEDRTILLQPLENFAEGETVTVTVGNDIELKSGSQLQGTSFQFYTRAPRTEEQKQHIAAFMRKVHDEDFPSSDLKPQGPPTKGIPLFTILTNTTTSPGDIFFSDFNFYAHNASYYCIVNNNGDSVFGKLDTVTFNNFDLNKNGYMTAYNKKDSTYIMFDSNYTAIKVYQMGNGYKADVHEFQILPDGTHYMLCYDPQIVDMTVYNPNYNPAAVVMGCVLQELDANGNVLFQWRSWDHFDIIEADHINFYNAEIDAVHSNAIDIDNDGNILLTSRHLSEITKINSETGDIIWRFGGGNGNQFTFTNDADKISWPHDGRRIANGHITVFDNGNYHSPAVTHGKEYQLDEVNKTATLVWSYKRTTSQGDLVSKAMGNCQRLDNGNTLLCWGLINGLDSIPKITEVDSLGNIVWELQLANDDAVYRAHRHNWSPCARPSNSTIKVNSITATSAKIVWKQATNATSYEVQYRKSGTITWTTKNFIGISAKLKNLTPSTKYEFQVRSHCNGLPTSVSAWSDLKKFKTSPQRISLDDQPALSVDLYPNPTASDITLTLNSSNAQSVTISVFDASGKLFLKESKQVDQGEEQFQLDTNALPAGFYFAEVAASSGTEVKKFIKE